MGGASEAERVLRQKFELLRRKKQQEQEHPGRRQGMHVTEGGGSYSHQLVRSAQPPVGDPVRLAAVAALKAKRAAEQGGKRSSNEPAGKKRQTTNDKPTSIKLGFKVSGTKSIKVPDVAQQEQQQQQQIHVAPAVVSSEKKPLSKLKRPALRRPAVAVRKEGSSQEDLSQPQNLELVKPREREEFDKSQETTFSQPSVPQVVVSGLPKLYTSDMLWEFFSEFHDVVDAHIDDDNGLGYITFSSFDDAHAVLDFQAHQPILIDDDHVVNIEWAGQVDHDTPPLLPDTIEVPLKEPMQSTQPERDVVSYDDL